jgi:dihydrofolate reductase
VGRIIISDNLTIDGVFEDPAGDEGFERGGWVGAIKDRPDLLGLALDDAQRADAFLMGRRTYEWFSGRWPSRSGPLADRLNSMPKYVVSSTLESPEWTNSTVITGDLSAEVEKLKQEHSGDVVVHGSVRLVQGLLEQDLVDELRLMVFPVVLGTGKTLFGETSDKKPLKLVDSKTVGDGVVILTYRRA